MKWKYLSGDEEGGAQRHSLELCLSCMAALALPVISPSSHFTSQLSSLSLSLSFSRPSLFAFGVFPSRLSIPPPLIQCELLS